MAASLPVPLELFCRLQPLPGGVLLFRAAMVCRCRRRDLEADLLFWLADLLEPDWLPCSWRAALMRRWLRLQAQRQADLSDLRHLLAQLSQ